MRHAILGWVKPELDEILRQARNEIESFADHPADISRMRSCAGYLHQVQGTLRMVELYAPAMMAEELELLAKSVQTGEAVDREEACAMLMRGTVLLPDYLERLQNGHRDVPIVLLPLLNEIRARRGQPGLNESVLSAFDPHAGNVTEAELEHARGSLSGRNRELLHTVASAVKEELLRVKDALDLHLRTGSGTAQLQVQVKDLGSVADTLDMMGLRVACSVVVQQRDALARLIQRQDPQVDEDVLLDIAGALLYVDASLDEQVASLGADIVDSQTATASAAAAEVRRTVDVLAQEAIVNFSAARECCVAFIETNWDHARLTQVPQLLAEVGGALRILELPRAADCLEGVRRYIDVELIGKQRVPSGRQLDTLADAMASLEYYLEALHERRSDREDILDIAVNRLQLLRDWPLPPVEPSQFPGIDGQQERLSNAPMPASLTEQADPFAVSSRAAPTVVQMLDHTLEWSTPAAFAGTVVDSTAVQDLDTSTAFSFDPVAAGEHVTGQVRMLPIGVMPPELQSDQVPGEQVLAPGPWSLDTSGSGLSFDPVLAEQDGQALPAIQMSYTVDMDLLEQAPGQALLPAEEPASQIPSMPQAEDRPFRQAPPDRVPEADAASDSLLSPIEDISPVHIAPASEVSPMSEAVVERDGIFGNVDNRDIDSDIREVFLEEFDEELLNLKQLLPVWRGAPQNFENLRAIRRVFHTLKGSGHLVGAAMLGDFSWQIEAMLNRVLDLSRPASPAVVAMVEQAYAVLVQLNAALRGQGRIEADLPAIQAVAGRIAAGEEADDAPAAAMPDEMPGAAVIHAPTIAATDGTPASVDSVLLEILQAEVAMHLDTMHAWLRSSQIEPQLVSDPLLRAMHTMNGAFAMTEVPEITEVTAPAENYLKRLLAAATAPSREGVEALADAAAAVAVTMTALGTASPLIPSFAGLSSRLKALAADLPQAQWLPQVSIGALEVVHALDLPQVGHATEQQLAICPEDEVRAAVADVSPVPAEIAESATSGAQDTAIGSLAAGSAMILAESIDTTSIDTTPAANSIGVPAISDAVLAGSLADPADGRVRLALDTPAQADAVNDPGAAFDSGPLDFEQLDCELVDIFVEEGRDLLDHCEGLIAHLRYVPEDRDALTGLQRDLHTFKGGARMAGIDALGDLAHAIESLLEVVAANRTGIDREDVRLLESGFDCLYQLLARTGAHRAVVMPAELIAAFQMRTGSHGAAAFTDAQMRAIAQVSVKPAPLSAPVPLEERIEKGVSPRAPHAREQVRVRADLLDRLVNHAGEMAVYRSQLEQQLGAFRGAMAELDRTNARLGDQLRRLDLETEAQIVARYEREQDQGERVFDPLELDRFSTLQQLSRALNESAADLDGLQGVLDELSRQYDGLLQQQSRVSSELQDSLMRARMVPFESLLPRLRRVVRQAAADTGKQVQLLLEGTHDELDRHVLDRMVAPLEHILRNGVAHGVETPEWRAAVGKPEEGRITIGLRREGSEIVLEVADDGAGLDRQAIRRRGEQRGLIERDQVLSEAELDELIFASGFSTSAQVSQLAGRGVGMDVVRSAIRQLGGTVEILSVPGQGVTFIMRLPQTLAVTQAVFVRVGETLFAVPVASISGIGRISRTRYESGQGGYHYAGEEYVLYELGALVGQAAVRADGQPQIPLLLVSAGDLRAAVAIDHMLGSREIVVKPVGLQIASLPGIYGATITADGRVVVILDVAPLVRRYLAQPEPRTVHLETQRQVPLVMVVDDSLTMRKITSRVLERHNFEVRAARDGIEALKLLEDRVPDLLLLDIEMPRMDGYELAAAMRADPRYRHVPIMMVTSRSGEKHRQCAFQIGVQRYLGKPYQELDLMRNVYDLLGIARVRE